MSDTHLLPEFWSHELNASFTDVEKYWLSRPGALTSGLRKVGEFSIRVLNEYLAYVKEDEAYPLGLAINQKVWVREILMSINGKMAVFARSITELNASRTTWQGIRALNARPLADILYNDPAITRGSFESTKLNNQLSLYHALTGYSELPWGDFPARRSTFFQNEEGLTVNEIFLPGFWEELAKHPLEKQINF
ncbi:MAG: chorismate lyase [Alcaligenaceae bacterium]|jgi:chorismate--pyruvate lyase|nr:chorismate lyase [Alcaligenaceae bacterium]